MLHNLSKKKIVNLNDSHAHTKPKLMYDIFNPDI